MNAGLMEIPREDCMPVGNSSVADSRALKKRQLEGARDLFTATENSFLACISSLAAVSYF